MNSTEFSINRKQGLQGWHGLHGLFIDCKYLTDIFNKANELVIIRVIRGNISKIISN